MAIDTIAEKLSLITYGQHWMGPIPIPSGSLDQADKQHSLAGYAGILWVTAVAGLASRKQSRYIVAIID